MAKKSVAIILGSDSDWPAMEACFEQLKALGVEADVQVLSAHRTPDQLRDYVLDAEDRGVGVFVAGAGMAAALPGAIAAHTTLPVIGVPLDSGGLDGLDSLLSIVQMPPGVPVATVALGKAGAKNAALLATQILALGEPVLAEALKKHKRMQAETVDNKRQSLREQLRLG